MTFFLCKLWPYLAGGLIGWLLAGWFARRLKYVEPLEKIVEKQVEKIVDNPEHLALISKLESENSKIPDLVTNIAKFESAAPKVVEKEIEKIVEVEKIVETEVDNPDHLKRIEELEAQIDSLKKGPVLDLKAARAAGIVIKNEDDLTAIEGIGPKINDLIKADGIQTFVNLADTDPSTIQKTLDNAGSRFAMANPGTWPDQANLAANNRWPALKALQDVLIGGVYPDSSSSEKGNSSGSATNVKKTEVTELDLAAAKAVGFNLKQKDGQDDFTAIEGIGPKINELIHNDNIHSFGELGSTKVEVIQGILDRAGSRYKLAKPGTWPAQADMAAENKWEALKAWQDELDGGE